MGSGSFIKVVFKNFDVLAGPVISLVYPLYASVRAIETKSREDDQQWLTYWVLYSLITLFELTFAKVIEVLPFWSYAKLILNCWLVLPYFSGAAYVYQHYVRTLFVNNQTVNIWYVPRKKDMFSRPDDVLVAAEKFIAENGPEALEKLMNKAGKATRFRSGSHLTTVDETSKSRSDVHSTVLDEAPKPRIGGRTSILEEASKFRSGHSTILDEVHAERDSHAHSSGSFYSIFGGGGTDDYRY